MNSKPAIFLIFRWWLLWLCRTPHRAWYLISIHTCTVSDIIVPSSMCGIGKSNRRSLNTPRLAVIVETAIFLPTGTELISRLELRLDQSVDIPVTLCIACLLPLMKYWSHKTLDWSWEYFFSAAISLNGALWLRTDAAQECMGVDENGLPASKAFPKPCFQPIGFHTANERLEGIW